jgi:hypothetical protein
MEEKYKIHACYILGILLAIIVILVTVQWSGIPNLAEKISFALTLASLILAALAIGYAVYSNSSLSQTISTLNNVSTNVSNTAKGIAQAATDLAQKIETIPSKLESMEGKVDQTNILIQQYSEKNALLQQVPEKTDDHPKTEEEKQAVNEIIDLFLSNCSINGLLILHACSISHSKKLSFNLEQLFSGFKFIQVPYAQGFLVAASSAGLLNFTLSKGIWNILSINEKLDKGIRPELDKRGKDEDMHDIKEGMEADIKSIEEYFML